MSEPQGCNQDTRLGLEPDLDYKNKDMELKLETKFGGAFFLGFRQMIMNNLNVTRIRTKTS